MLSEREQDLLLQEKIVKPDQAIVIGPELAEDLLSRNLRNRTIRPQKVQALAGVLRRGEWRYNGDAIRISSSGRLLDGQHRLRAVVETGIPITSLIVLVPDDEAQTTMDQGLKRGFNDYLHMRGLAHANTLAAAIRMVWAWEKTGVPTLQNTTLNPTIPQLRQAFERHPDLADSLRVSRCPFVTKSFVVGMHYLFSLVDHADADAFFDLLTSGDGLALGHPIYALRERLIREQARTTGDLHTTVKTGMFFRTFNAWRAGDRLVKLIFRLGGANPDRFPRLTIDPEVLGGPVVHIPGRADGS